MHSIVNGRYGFPVDHSPSIFWEQAVQGVVIAGNKKIVLQHFDDPVPGTGEVIVAIKASGICGTDLHRFRGEPEQGAAIISGHEPAGIVVAVGSGVTPLMAREGMRVMVHHYQGCAACGSCRTGWTQMCETGEMKLYGRSAHGSNAAFMKVPAYSIIPLHDALSFEAGAAIGCGTGTAWGALDRMKLKGTETIVIFGQGPVGASATMLAAAQGARVIALDVQQSRLDLAKAFGATAVINPLDGDVVAKILDLTNGRGADMALETSGNNEAMIHTLDCVRPWGVACFVGVGTVVSLDVYAYLRKQLTIMTSWTMSHMGQRACADFIVDRGLNIDALFSNRWQITEAQQAFDEFDKQSAGKGVFLFD
jgi:threonine dehydrogenase-like Zn-dependent dehydrogenase